jgi:hypothetical protein
VAIASLGFLRNLVTIPYGAKGMLEDVVWHRERRFFVGACLAWTTTDAIIGIWAQTTVHSLAILLVALIWCKIAVLYIPLRFLWSLSSGGKSR